MMGMICSMHVLVQTNVCICRQLAKMLLLVLDFLNGGKTSFIMYFILLWVKTVLILHRIMFVLLQVVVQLHPQKGKYIVRSGVVGNHSRRGLGPNCLTGNQDSCKVQAWVLTVLSQILKRSRHTNYVYASKPLREVW